MVVQILGFLSPSATTSFPETSNSCLMHPVQTVGGIQWERQCKHVLAPSYSELVLLSHFKVKYGKLICLFSSIKNTFFLKCLGSEDELN